MKRKNLVLAIGTSLYSGKFYREVAASWRGRAFVYVLLLLVICSLFTTTKLMTGFVGWFNDFSSVVVPQIPVVTFKQGVATTKAQKPYYIKYDQAFMVVDTGNQIKDFQSNPDLVLILKSDRVSIKKNSGEIRTYYFRKNMTGAVGPQVIQKLIYKYKIIFFIVASIGIYLFMVGFAYAGYLLFALFAALLSMIYSAAMKRRLDYGALLSLALIVLTPIILLRTIIFLTGIGIRLGFIPALVIVLVYLFFAVKANPKKEST